MINSSNESPPLRFSPTLRQKWKSHRFTDDLFSKVSDTPSAANKINVDIRDI